MKKLLAGLQSKSLVHKLRQTQLIAYLSLTPNVVLLLTFVLFVQAIR
ncbi:hypothetical protein ACFC4K_11880 [Enterococcus durans]